MNARLAGLVAVGLLATATADVRADGRTGAAASDESDDIVPDARARDQAAEANLEPERMREGLAIGVSLGPSMQVGFDIEEASAVGGSLDLRIGTSATDRLAWFVDLLVTGTGRKTDSSKNTLNQNSSLTLGGQLFILQAVHLRAGAGLASLALRSDERTKNGLGLLGGGGIDFLRRGRLALSADLTFTFSVYGDGAVGAFAGQLGATWY